MSLDLPKSSFGQVQYEPCEGNLVAAAGSCSGLMVKHPWPLLEISLSDFRRLATLNINTYDTFEQTGSFKTKKTENDFQNRINYVTTLMQTK